MPSVTKMNDRQVRLVSQRVIPSCYKHMDEAERIAGTRQMIRDLESMAVKDGGIAAAWALDFIKAVTFF